jgi:hypothetical protein
MKIVRIIFMKISAKSMILLTIYGEDRGGMIHVLSFPCAGVMMYAINHQV